MALFIAGKDDPRPCTPPEIAPCPPPGKALGYLDDQHPFENYGEEEYDEGEGWFSSTQ